jgi:hypothetical protein
VAVLKHSATQAQSQVGGWPGGCLIQHGQHTCKQA